MARNAGHIFCCSTASILLLCMLPVSGTSNSRQVRNSSSCLPREHPFTLRHTGGRSWVQKHKSFSLGDSPLISAESKPKNIITTSPLIDVNLGADVNVGHSRHRRHRIFVVPAAEILVLETFPVVPPVVKVPGSSPVEQPFRKRKTKHIGIDIMLRRILFKT